MRCLHCNEDNLPLNTQTCPVCSVSLPDLLKKLLPVDSELQGGLYRIDYPLGYGGFGVTYQGTHMQLNLGVAIKEYFPNKLALRQNKQVITIASNTDVFKQGKTRFQREGEILTRLRHPNVVQVTNLFEETGTAYLVMELIKGQTLRKVLDDKAGKLKPNKIEQIMTQIVEALAEIHTKKIYHLDLKPENIMLDDERVVLVDFGAAKVSGQSETSSFFTINYAAPEMFSSIKKGAESDVYALGVMLHQMLTGKLPPIAIHRVIGEGQNWKPALNTESWQRVVEAALRLNQNQRPKNVRAWWASRHHFANSISPKPQIIPPGSHSPPLLRKEPRTIQEAIQLAGEGYKILLQPGQYNESITLNDIKNIQLIGQGDGVKIISPNRRPSLSISNCHGIRIEGISFQLIPVGGQPCSVIQIAQSKNIHLVSCRTSGAGTRAGVEVFDKSQAVIQNNHAAENRLGFYVRSGSSGEITDSIAEANAQYGIWVQGEETSVNTRNNQCNNNGEVGIIYSDEATGSVEGNHCGENGNHGIVIANHIRTKTKLGPNRCFKNTRSGIFWDKNWQT